MAYSPRRFQSFTHSEGLQEDVSVPLGASVPLDSAYWTKVQYLLSFYSPKFHIIFSDRSLGSEKLFESIELGVLSGEAEGTCLKNHSWCIL
jgi:hypothetical protein